MVDLKALEKSLAKIEAVGHEELDFEAEGTRVVLRPLTPEEENEVERYSRTAFEIDGKTVELDSLPDSERTMLNRVWIDRLRQATLAFVIAEIDDKDLRHVDFVETGETDSQGKPISRPRYEVMRDLISRWGRPVLTQMFAAYGELMDRINLRASKLVSFDPAEVEEEKIRLRKRLEELESRDTQNREPKTLVDVVKNVNDVDVMRKDTVAQMRTNSGGSETTAPVPSSHPPKFPSIKEGIRRAHEYEQQRDLTEEEQAKMPQRDDPLIPKTVRRPVSEQIPQAPSVPERTSTQAGEPTEQAKIPEPFEGDSFFDPADGDMAYAAEVKRQEEMYRRKQERDRQVAESAKQKPIIQGRAKRPAGPTGGSVSDDRTGLRNALNTGNAVFDAGAGQMQRPQSSFQPTGKKGQVDIYRMPATTLERRGPQVDPSQIQIDPESSSRNPRFKPAREDT